MAETKLQRLRARHGALKTERSPFETDYRDIAEFLLPGALRLQVTDGSSASLRSRGSIFDSRATRALRIMTAGLQGGATSPARPWFRLSIKDTELNDYEPVKRWLSTATRIMLTIFSRSNTYRSLHGMYVNLGGFGTSATMLLKDFENVIHHYPLVTGQYCLAADYKGNVNTLYREFRMTVANVVREYGKQNCSTTVQNMYDSGRLDSWVPIIHVIEPREDREYGKRDAKNMPFASCTFEQGGDGDKYLRESGFDEFPVLAPRWEVLGEDVYGEGPAHEALGDIKSLQHEQLRKGQGIDYMTQPPLAVPTSMRNNPVQRMPGGITYTDNPANNSIKSLWDVNLNLSHLREDIVDIRERIDAAFFVDVFMMMSNIEKGNLTATEVAERHEEKMLIMGPVLERLHNELLSPKIDLTFSHMLRAGLLPPIPEELIGVDLDVEFVSMLAQAQRAINVNSIDRFVANLGQLAAFKPDVLDKFDADKWVDEYSDMLGVSPEIIVPSDQVALIRKSRAEVQQQQATLQAANMQADTAQKAASASAQAGPVTDMLNQFSGYGSPTGVDL